MEYNPIIFRAFSFPIRFTSTKRVVEFLNESNYLQAIDVKIRSGKLSDRDNDNETTQSFSK